MNLWVWHKVWVFLILGYLLMGRSFAYLGLPSLKLFVGEIGLGAFALLRPDRLFRPWTSWSLGRGPLPLVFLSWALTLFLLYGVWQLLRGILLLGYEPTLALQNFVFNFYPLYLFLGLWIGMAKPDCLRSVVRLLAWANGIYGVLYMFVLSRLNLFLPWAPDVPLFGQPGGSAIVLLGLLALEIRLIRLWPLLLLNFIVLLGLQVRGEWLAFALGFIVWLIWRRDLWRPAFFGSIVALMLLLMYLFDIRVPAPEHRGGELSVKGIIGRLVSPFNPKSAVELVGEEAYSMAGTIVGWRIPWWKSIWDTVHSDPMLALFGLGYGFPLYQLFDEIPEGVRSPHNVFFYALGYGGWVGVIFFLAFQGVLGFAAYRVATLGGTPYGTMLWFGLLGSALFGNFLETPFGAIPFYLLIGYSLASLTGKYAHTAIPHLLPAIRR